MPSIRGVKSKKKTRRHTRDLDQLHQDLADPKHLAAFKAEYNPPTDELPGLGQFYCVECALWLPCAEDQAAHERGKKHKRRVRQLKEEPYSQQEAERAIGRGVDNGQGVQLRPVPSVGPVVAAAASS